MHNNFGMQHIYRRLQKRTKQIRKFIGDYFYYLKHNHSYVEAWSMAKNTL